MTVSDLRAVLELLKEHPGVRSVRLGDLEVHLGAQAVPAMSDDAVEQSVKRQRAIEAEEDKRLMLAHVEGYAPVDLPGDWKP